MAVVRAGDEGYMRLLVLDPAHRGRGLGHDLLRAAEQDLRGVKVITVGADAPYFLFPGVPVAETALCCLLERHHYSREETNYNVDIDLAGLPLDPGGAIAPDPDERAEVELWMGQHWPHWQAEVLRAFDQRSLLVARDDDGPHRLLRLRREPRRHPRAHRVTSRPHRQRGRGHRCSWARCTDCAPPATAPSRCCGWARSCPMHGWAERSDICSSSTAATGCRRSGPDP